MRKRIAVACLAGALLIGTALLGPPFIGNRTLTQQERALAESLFASSVDYSRVRVNEGGPLTWIPAGITTGNVISFPRGTYDENDKRDGALFLHEMTHVWQYQHIGVSYAWRSVYEEVTQPDAYVVHYDANKRFSEYDLEEQGEIVAEYFLTGDERYVPYMEELQESERPAD